MFQCRTMSHPLEPIIAQTRFDECWAEFYYREEKHSFDGRNGKNPSIRSRMDQLLNRRR